MSTDAATSGEADLVDVQLDTAAVASPEQVGRVSQELIRHQRLMHLVKAEMANRAPDGLEWGSHAVLMHLVHAGAMGQKALADCSLLDPSTISRRVSQLVGGGYVERRPDPADGRAVQLAATARGEEVFDRISAQRAELLRQLFSDWTAQEVETFARQFRRLNDRLEAVRPLLSGSPPEPPSTPAARRPVAQSSTNHPSQREN